jgi:cysteine desulfurase family protein
LQRVVDRCRQRAARLLGAESAERVIFTFNGTDGLNLALHGVLAPGEHVVTSVMEHNSVLRPLRELKERIGIDVTYVPADGSGLVDPDAFRAALTPRTKLVALLHASNVTGTIQPVAEVGRIAKEAGVLFLVDAAQSAGHTPIDLSQLPVDLLACSGHKGLLGPLGTGLLYVRTGVEQQLRSLRQGGTGSQSEDDHQPEFLPDKYESGNHNAPGIVGLEAGLAWIEERGVESLRAHERGLTERLRAGLREVAGVRLCGPEDPALRTGVVSLTIDGLEPQDVAAILDETFGIEVRSGLHCAPRAHQAIGTFDSGGTVRLSVGALTTEEEIDASVAALRQLAASRGD